MKIPFLRVGSLVRPTGFRGVLWPVSLVWLVVTTTGVACSGSANAASAPERGLAPVAPVTQAAARPAADSPRARMPTAAAAGPPDMGPGRGPKAADANGDGRISRAEFMQYHEAIFERLPKDADGQVSVEDAIRHGGMRGGETPAGSRPAGPMAPSPAAHGPTAPGGMAPGAQHPGGATAPARRPSEATEVRPSQSGSSSPDGEPEPEPERDREPVIDAASSGSSAASSNPSSTAPQDAKPGQ